MAGRLRIPIPTWLVKKIKVVWNLISMDVSTAKRQTYSDHANLLSAIWVVDLTGLILIFIGVRWRSIVRQLAFRGDIVLLATRIHAMRGIQAITTVLVRLIHDVQGPKDLKSRCGSRSMICDLQEQGALFMDLKHGARHVP